MDDDATQGPGVCQGVSTRRSSAAEPMAWRHVSRVSVAARRMADRHYYRKVPGHREFTPPGRAVVLTAPAALWVSSWPRFVRDEWAGAWRCVVFRNEGALLSSLLIRQAVAATRHAWGTPPLAGMITFVDARRIRSVHPGYCFKCAGFEQVGYSKVHKLVTLRLAPEDMPPAHPAWGRQLSFLEQEESEDGDDRAVGLGAGP